MASVNDAQVPIWLCKPIAQFSVISFYVRTSEEADISCCFVIDLDAVIILFALSFNKTYELLCILFRIGIRKSITAIVPKSFYCSGVLLMPVRLLCSSFAV